nr:MAG TPA: hypothetical protein [Caudoviricetes sp.]
MLYFCEFRAIFLDFFLKIAYNIINENTRRF